METFVEEHNISRIEPDLLEGYNWTWIVAKRVKQRGRAIAGGVMGVRSSLRSGNHWLYADHFVIGCKVEFGELPRNIVGIYNRSGMRIKNVINSKLKSLRGERIILLADMNARIGERGNGNSQNSLNNVCDAEGKAMLEWLGDSYISILNGEEITPT